MIASLKPPFCSLIGEYIFGRHSSFDDEMRALSSRSIPRPQQVKEMPNLPILPMPSSRVENIARAARRLRYGYHFFYIK